MNLRRNMKPFIVDGNKDAVLFTAMAEGYILSKGVMMMARYAQIMMMMQKHTQSCLRY